MNPSSKPALRYRFAKPCWHWIFGLIDAIGEMIVRLVRRLRRTPDFKAPPSPHEVRRVLLVQFDHLGDAVLTTSLLPDLRRLYPQATIDVLCAPWNYEIFSRPETSRTFVSRWNRFQRGRATFWPASTLYWGWKLRARRYDLAIDIRGDFSIALLLSLAGVPRRVGWNCGGGGFLLTDCVEFVHGRHEVESRREILRTLGNRSARLTPPKFAPSPEAERFVAHMLGEFLHGGRPLLVFHISAGTEAKRWPVEHWRELLGRAVVELDARVVLVGGPNETAVSQAVTQEQYWPGVMDWTGRLTIDQLAALMRRSDAVVSADSGPAHLAAAVGAETVVLFSGTNLISQWRPWGERVHVLRHDVPCAPCSMPKCRFADHPCLRGLTPTTVLERLESILGGPMILTLPIAAARSDRGGGAG